MRPVPVKLKADNAPVKVGAFVIVTLGVVPPEEAMLPEPVTAVTVPEPEPQALPVVTNFVPSNWRHWFAVKEVLFVPPLEMERGLVSPTVAVLPELVTVIGPDPTTLVRPPLTPLESTLPTPVEVVRLTVAVPVIDPSAITLNAISDAQLAVTVPGAVIVEDVVALSSVVAGTAVQVEFTIPWILKVPVKVPVTSTLHED